MGDFITKLSDAITDIVRTSLEVYTRICMEENDGRVDFRMIDSTMDELSSSIKNIIDINFQRNGNRGNN